ncbi:DUF2254 domain-containing protein [Streptomyces sp. NPDC059169]|uniref:DUF2254 domain-containing protein n=1 Tax=Streptomyces sp. NPDC059169 TaxID=3346754 RepID=UPI0036B5F95E
MREGLRSQLWPLPVLGVLLALGAGIGLPALDGAVGRHVSLRMRSFLFGGGPDAARAVLEAIAGSLISVTALTFSLTVVALQLASSQFSPRLLRTFAADRYVQATLALFLATFTYALTVLRTVRTAHDAQPAFVPQMSVTLAFALALASILGLVLFLSHLARELRVETMLVAVHHDAEDTMERILGTPADEGTDGAPVLPPRPPGDAVPLLAARSGFLTAVDESVLLRAAARADAVVLVDRPPGGSLIAGTPCGRVWRRDGSTFPPDVLDRLLRQAADAVVAGGERTDEQDVAFALRQLTDVAVKALSPGVNDPTTAVHALSHSSALLCAFAQRPLGPRLLHDADGRLRVMLERPDLPALLELAVSQPLRYGSAEPEVLRRIAMLLHEVAWTAPPARRTDPGALLQRLRVTVAGQDFSPEERDRLDELVRRAERTMRPGGDAPGGAT